jgi:hypothetical protein
MNGFSIYQSASIVAAALLAALPCDLDGNGHCDLADYAVFQAAFDPPAPTPATSPTPAATPAPGQMLIGPVRLNGRTLEDATITLNTGNVTAYAVELQGGATLRNCRIVSNQHAISAVGAGNRIEGCTIECEGYGVYWQGSGVIRGNVIAARRRDPLRIASGDGIEISGNTLRPTLAAVAFRIHDVVSNCRVTANRIEATNPWGLDCGEQYAGAGCTLKNVSIENNVFVAGPQSIHAVRVRTKGVTVGSNTYIGVWGKSAVSIEVKP